jgi:DNA-directed RNA polymerase subunit beta'
VRINGHRYDTTVGRVLLWEIMPKDKVCSVAPPHGQSDEKIMTKVSKKALAGNHFPNLVATYSESPTRITTVKSGFLKERFQRVFDVAPDDADAVFSLSVEGSLPS